MSTHRDDTDMFLVKHAVEDRFKDIVTMNKSTHHGFPKRLKDVKSNLALRLAGKGNFLPVDYNYNNYRNKPKPKDEEEAKKEEKSLPGIFNPANFAPARKALEKGKAILISAHNPTYDPAQDLDEINGGYGGVYLASLADAWILPVTVALDKSTEFGGEKANATVAIGKPFKLKKIDGIERFADLMIRRSNLDTEEKTEFFRLADALRDRSKSVMQIMSGQLVTQNEGFPEK